MSASGRTQTSPSDPEPPFALLQRIHPRGMKRTLIMYPEDEVGGLVRTSLCGQICERNGRIQYSTLRDTIPSLNALGEELARCPSPDFLWSRRLDGEGHQSGLERLLGEISERVTE